MPDDPSKKTKNVSKAKKIAIPPDNQEHPVPSTRLSRQSLQGSSIPTTSNQPYAVTGRATGETATSLLLSGRTTTTGNEPGSGSGNVLAETLLTAPTLLNRLEATATAGVRQITRVGGAIRDTLGFGGSGTGSATGLETGSVHDGETNPGLLQMGANAASGIRHAGERVGSGIEYVGSGIATGLGFGVPTVDDDVSIYSNEENARQQNRITAVPRQMVGTGVGLLESGATEVRGIFEDIGDFAMIPAHQFMRQRQRPKEGYTKISAPKTLVVTLESNMEEKMENYGYILRRRMTGGAEGDVAMDVITKQIHDLGELEWMLDEESKMMLRRHVIYWKSALSMPRHRMKIRIKDIPLAATKDYCHHLPKCERCGRSCCCIISSSKRKTMMEDCMTVESLRNFMTLQNEIANCPSATSVNIKSKMRRQPVFDATLPAYAAFLMK